LKDKEEKRRRKTKVGGRERNTKEEERSTGIQPRGVGGGEESYKEEYCLE
jgi:hypothetical protein